MGDQNFWRGKLAAFLHDPPDKCFDIAGHRESASQFMAGAGIVAEDHRASQEKDVVNLADHFSSAAERFVFPRGKCSTSFSGQTGSSFIHPISSTPYVSGNKLPDMAGHFHGILQDAVGGIKSDDCRVKFFLYWRRWMENSVANDKKDSEHLAFLPADTRIPDHSIWNHIAVTSAVAGCVENGVAKPAMLLFQLGPVQEFISQARSTRDLWSGSYLLSWLAAHAMKAVSDQVGPDAIMFPNLRGNGIFDALHKDSMYSTKWKDGGGTEMSLWDRMKAEKVGGQVANWLLTPTLPNRFLALVPEAKAEDLARSAQDAINAELKNIGGAVWDWISKEAARAQCSGVDNWKKRWDYQIEVFPQTSWAVQPWLDRDDCLKEFAKLPVNTTSSPEKKGTPLQRLQDMLDFGEKWLPPEHRDERYYFPGAKEKLNNPGILWSAHYALVDAKLAARRNTRDFNAWNTHGVESCPKDSLSGKEEIIGDERFWNHLTNSHGKIFTSGGHRYGAMNLVKRLWCRSDKVSYLPAKLGLSENEFKSTARFETVEDIAKGNKGANPYVAILSMDGDDMGKWVSGEKTPEFLKQISAAARKYLGPILREKGKENLRRMLTPSYHLQFSEALSNFSTWLADPIVSKFNGQLIYAGGDDVLAMLPADKAIECAEALRAVFRGEPPTGHHGFNLAVTHPGFVMENAGYPLIVPGSEADVSIGIAIGHFKSPLQMLVKEAHKAEKRAKKEYGKGAVALSLYKRSGEIIEWGCKWDNKDGHVGLTLMKKITEYSSEQENNAKLPGRFAYALAQLLQPYELHKPKRVSISDESLKDIMLKEFEHVVRQQGKNLPPKDKEELMSLAEKWLVQTKGKLDDFIKLFLVETFINRHAEEA